MRGKKVLITGGLGNLGSWLTRHFANQGCAVYVLTRKDKIKLEGISYSVIEADITDMEMLRNKLTISFDICIHAASFNEHFLEGYAQKALLINALGTRNLLEALSIHGVKKFIYMSTFHVYGASSGSITEETPLLPKNDYATTHLCAEYYVKQLGFTYKLDYTIFRLTNSYGCPSSLASDKWYLVLNDLVRAAYTHHQIVLKSNGEALRDFIWMGDVCNIISHAIDFPMGETYNLSAEKSYKIIDIAKMVKNIYEKRYAKTIKIEINEHDNASYAPLLVSNAKLKKILNIDIYDQFENEITKIFDLLEQSDG